MECEECEVKAVVVDTRHCLGNQYRKRKCLECGKTFWTMEIEAEPDDVRLMLSIEKMKYRDRKRGN